MQDNGGIHPYAYVCRAKSRSESIFALSRDGTAIRAAETLRAPLGTMLADAVSGSDAGYIKDYVDACIACPRLYTLGGFRNMLDAAGRTDWRLRSIGFLAPDGSEYDSSGRIADPRDPDGIDEAFGFADPEDAALLSLHHAILERAPVKKCACCGRYFVPLLRSDAIYCDRPSPQDPGKTCKEYGSKVLWYKSIVGDDVSRLSRNVYCAKQMLAKRHPGEPEYSEMFEAFKAGRKEREARVKAGAETREEYAAWLRLMKSCRTPADLAARKGEKRA